MKKQELLDALLKTQREGKLEDKNLIAKVECADERVVEQWNEKLEKNEEWDWDAYEAKHRAKDIKKLTPISAEEHFKAAKHHAEHASRHTEAGRLAFSRSQKHRTATPEHEEAYKVWEHHVRMRNDHVRARDYHIGHAIHAIDYRDVKPTAEMSGYTPHENDKHLTSQQKRQLDMPKEKPKG